MQGRREEMRAKLRAEADAIVEECLNWQEGAKAPTLTEMEDVVLMLRERLSKRMLELMVTEQEAVKPEAAPRCGQCGEVMTYKGQKKRGVGTRAGVLAMERAHYYCPGCEAGLFPPGPAVAGGGGVLE